MSWKRGDRITHRFNPELGTGMVMAVEGRTVVVHFPTTDTALRLATNSDAIKPLVLREGSRALIVPSGEQVMIETVLEHGVVVLSDGREVEESELWPMDLGHSLTERLAQGEVDKLDEFSLRLDALHLAAIRQADGLGSFLGGRIRLFPHQFHVAEQATQTDPVRWLLADEVGLGKTVEACLILNRLLRTGRADRTLVVAPETLTVQWLGELWRKYHQVFVLLDDKRLADVEKDYGKGFNPFDAHSRVVVSLEMLVERPKLTKQAIESGIDLLIVDEAHHLQRPPGHPGEPGYRAVAPIAATGRHVLLLSATPLEDDAHGFFRLLQLLRPDEFPEDGEFEQRLERGDALPPCTSATRREDIGGLPPRAARPIEVGTPRSWEPQERLIAEMRSRPAKNAVEKQQKARRIRRAMASGAALEAVLDRSDAVGRDLATEASETDPRIEWLTGEARRWKMDGDKTLVFVAHRETLELIKTAMSRSLQLRVGVFHEDLSAGQRDIEVAQFRLSSGPSMLVSTECGGEGRNFEFCTRLVLFDLPWNPVRVEQRIGRLDRIGRRMPVEIAYFRPETGHAAGIARLYEALGLFREPLGGVEQELAAVESAVAQTMLSKASAFDVTSLDEIVGQARQAQDRVKEAAYRELHRNPYDPSKADEILDRVPPELEELAESVIIGAAEALNMHVEEHRGSSRYSVELGSRARVESLPGVPSGSSFLGTFDREEAVEEENIDFFASGHPLVEGLLAHLDESPIGRVGLLHVGSDDGQEGLGLLALYKEGPQFHAVALDATGAERPEWAELLMRRPLRSKRIKAKTWTGQPGWHQLVRAMARHLDGRGRPEAVAIFRIG
ncbi:MAG: DEAD/DEAH box helicase family protein [bacterium]|nr:DEAD/DEAH box helicase family protein [bacterium]